LALTPAGAADEIAFDAPDEPQAARTEGARRAPPAANDIRETNWRREGFALVMETSWARANKI
jgi:hypothetical protein